jgi:hypothetical protein
VRRLAGENVNQLVERRGAGFGPGCRRAASVTTVYVVRGLRLLGQHFTAFVWTTESGEVRRDEPRGGA